MSTIPIALERFSPPLTLPSMVTLPPAFLMRVSSTSSSGLWSYDMSTALPTEAQNTEHDTVYKSKVLFNRKEFA